MAVADLFMVTTRGDNPIRANTEGDTQPQNQGKVPDFVTVESLTFPASSAVVFSCWKVLQAVFGTWADAKAVPLVLAGLIVLAGIGSRWSKLGDGGTRVAAIAIGIINTLLLAAASVGVELTFFGDANGT